MKADFSLKPKKRRRLLSIWKEEAKRHEFQTIREIESKLTPYERDFLRRRIRKEVRAKPTPFTYRNLELTATSARHKTLINVDSPTITVQSFKPNPDRIVLGSVGKLELYCYPKLYPHRCFIGMYPKSSQIGEMEARTLMSLAMKALWFFRSGNRNFLRKYVKKKKENQKYRTQFRDFKGEESDFNGFKIE